jgi:hypothetical protein
MVVQHEAGAIDAAIRPPLREAARSSDRSATARYEVIQGAAHSAHDERFDEPPRRYCSWRCLLRTRSYSSSITPMNEASLRQKGG